MTSWLILRCSNVKTLELAKSLTEAGFEAWSPVETITLKAKRGLPAEHLTRALMPSFVFARYSRLNDLLELSRSPTLNYRVWDSEKRKMVTRGHPYFRVFRLLGEYRQVPDRQLAHLRTMERKSKPKGKVEPFEVGAIVRFTEGGFAGLTGRVEESRKDYTTVTICDWSIPVQISTWLLRETLDLSEGSVKVRDSSCEQASFAKAA